MKTHALQRTQEALEAQLKVRTRRSGSKSAQVIAGSGAPLPKPKEGAVNDGRKNSGAQKLSYKEAFKEMAAQADAERLEWTEWDADSGGLA